MRVVLRLFCFSEVAIVLLRVVTGVSRNVPKKGVFTFARTEETRENTINLADLAESGKCFHLEWCVSNNAH